jgi:putative membrane protein
MTHRRSQRPLVHALLAVPALPVCALAHDGGPVAPSELAAAWSFDVGVLALVGVLVGAYALGVRARRAHARKPSRQASRLPIFLVGVLTLMVALISPVAALGETLFAGHMVQHVLLTMVAAPLLVAADVGTMTVWALPLGSRRAIARVLRGMRPAWKALTRPLVAWMLHMATLTLWHWPPAYEAAVRSYALHAVEHVSFVATAIPFWWLVVGPYRRQRLRFGSALLYLFGASMAGALLGAFISLSRLSWYTVHGRGAGLWGLTPLEDQQIAGLVMWIPAGMIYLLVLVSVALPALRQRPVPTAA